jgi:glutathione S-transferase
MTDAGAWAKAIDILCAEQLFVHLDALDALLADGPWLVENAKSIADIAVAAQLDEILRTSAVASSILERPRIAEWLDHAAAVAILLQAPTCQFFDAL